MKLIFTLSLLLTLGFHTYAQTFNSTGTANIPDGTSTTTGMPAFGARVCVPITVTGVGNINTTFGLQSVCINITHPFVSDLYVYLQAPNGATIPLTFENGGAGANYTNTCFNMTATNPIFLGNAPFTGNFLPDYPIGWFNNNINANGVWNLCAEDGYQDDVGVINSWNITFAATPAPYPVTGCNGNIPASNFCQDASPVCNLNGYCGNTSFNYSPNVWPQLETAFCGSIENNSFIQFVASAATATFSVNVTNCTEPDPLNQGIQFMVYSGGCGSGAVTSFGCNNQMTPGVNSFTANGLTPGNTYYLMIDGFDGDVCNYSVTATSGVNVLTIAPASPTICTGGTGVSLTASGGNGNYTWSPGTGLSATTGATVTATPASTQTYTVTTGAIGSLNCPLTRNVTVTVAPPPVVSAPATVCVGNTITLSPTTGGTWVSSNNTIATVTNAGIVTGVSAGTATFTFTNTSSGCSATTTSVTVTAATITPTFNPVAPFCSGTVAPILPTTSTNGITGIWSPAVVSNTASGTYTFTPNPGQCSNNAVLNITVNPLTTPTFNPIAPFCSGSVAPVLPATSTNGITGTWNPTTVSNTASATYTFTPNAGQCASTTTLNVTVNPSLTPVVSCGLSTATSVIFNWTAVTGATTYNVIISINGGTPINAGNLAATTYLLAGLNVNDNVTITVTPIGFGGCFAAGTGNCTAVNCNPPTIALTSAPATNNQTICNNAAIADIVYTIGGSATGASVSGLPTGVTGLFSAGVFTISGNATASGTFTYTVTTSGSCAPEVVATGTLNVNAIITPTFNAIAPFCAGTPAPTLPTTSTNGITGTWNPTIVSNTASATYTFTPDPGQCASTTTLNVTVRPVTTPTFTPVLPFCAGATAPLLPTTSTNGITGTWSPAIVSNTASGIYTFTASPGQCVSTPVVVPIVVIPAPVVNLGNDTLVCDVNSLTLNATNLLSTYVWQDLSTNPTFTVTQPGLYSVTVTRAGCSTTDFIDVDFGTRPVFTLGASQPICPGQTILLTTLLTDPSLSFTWQDGSTNPTFTVTQPGVYFVDVENDCGPTRGTVAITRGVCRVFMPSAFTPNNDGVNDLYRAGGGENVNKYYITIFNRWGQKVFETNNITRGWDGKLNGKVQQTGAYVYAVTYTDPDTGKEVKLKGTIMLIR